MNRIVSSNYRVVIPKKFQNRLLEELHSSHLGMVKMTLIATSYFYWPNLDNGIKENCKACKSCQTNVNNSQKSEVIPWNRP